MFPVPRSNNNVRQFGAHASPVSSAKYSAAGARPTFELYWLSVAHRFTYTLLHHFAQVSSQPSAGLPVRAVRTGRVAQSALRLIRHCVCLQKCRVDVRFSPALSDDDIRREAVNLVVDELKRKALEQQQVRAAARLERDERVAQEPQVTTDHRSFRFCFFVCIFFCVGFCYICS